MAVDFFAGCVGGGAGVIVGHPLDTIKVRLQAQTVDKMKYRGTLHALITISKEESIFGLYRGLTSPLYGVSFVNALVFGVYGTLQPFVLRNPGNNSIWAHTLAGCAAGFAQSVVCSPMELIKIRMQLNESISKQPSSFKVLQNVYRNEGLRRGLFKGWWITVGREIPGYGSYFGSYQLLTEILEHRQVLTLDDGRLGTVGMMLAGGTAGVISWLACFPMDVIKTRFQSDIEGRYRGIWDCLVKTYQSEGYKVFTRTLPSLLIRAFPMSAVTFPIVTWIIRLSEYSQQKKQDSARHQELEAVSSRKTKQATNLTSIDIYRQFYDIPTYHLLTPRTPTIICSETQNPMRNFSFSNEIDIDLPKMDSPSSATLCPCCSLGESFETIPLFFDDIENSEGRADELDSNNSSAAGSRPCRNCANVGNI